MVLWWKQNHPIATDLEFRAWHHNNGGPDVGNWMYLVIVLLIVYSTLPSKYFHSVWIWGFQFGYMFIQLHKYFMFPIFFPQFLNISLCWQHLIWKVVRFDKATPALGKSTGYAAIVGKLGEIRTLDDSGKNQTQRVVLDFRKIRHAMDDLSFF